MGFDFLEVTVYDNRVGDGTIPHLESGSETFNEDSDVGMIDSVNSSEC